MLLLENKINFPTLQTLYLSEYHRCSIVINGIQYSSVIHALVGAKLCWDYEKIKNISRMSVKTLKDMEKEIPSPAFWNQEYVFRILVIITYHKFFQNKVLRDKLVLTNSYIEYKLPQYFFSWELSIMRDVLNYYGKVLMQVRMMFKQNKNPFTEKGFFIFTIMFINYYTFTTLDSGARISSGCITTVVVPW